MCGCVDGREREREREKITRGEWRTYSLCALVFIPEVRSPLKVHLGRCGDVTRHEVSGTGGHTPLET